MEQHKPAGIQSPQPYHFYLKLAAPGGLFILENCKETPPFPRSSWEAQLETKLP